jgi:hypothetical protein
MLLIVLRVDSRARKHCPVFVIVLFAVGQMEGINNLEYFYLSNNILFTV